MKAGRRNIHFNKFMAEVYKDLTREEQNQADRIFKKLREELNYHPHIGIMGKTGAGKSSLCNALFGQDICPISDVEACTRDPQHVLLEMDHNCRLTLIDLPGAGESRERDEEYSRLYASLLPKMDIVLWLIKADERAFTVDKEFYQNVVLPHRSKKTPFFIVLNQVDKVEPFREWDMENQCPGPNQAKCIERKQEYVSTVFHLAKSKIIAISAAERYNLMNLVDEMIFCLPSDNAKIVTAAEIKDDVISPKAEKETRNAFLRIIAGVVSGARLGGKIGNIVAGKVGQKLGILVGGVIGGAIAFFQSWF